MCLVKVQETRSHVTWGYKLMYRVGPGEYSPRYFSNPRFNKPGTTKLFNDFHVVYKADVWYESSTGDVSVNPGLNYPTGFHAYESASGLPRKGVGWNESDVYKLVLVMVELRDVVASGIEYMELYVPRVVNVARKMRILGEVKSD